MRHFIMWYMYADELVALTIADAQLEQMEMVVAWAEDHEGPEPSSSPNSDVSVEEPFTRLLSSDDNTQQ